MLAFGTDWDVAPLNPLEGIYAAVTRRTLDEKNPNAWVPKEKISITEAVKNILLMVHLQVSRKINLEN